MKDNFVITIKGYCDDIYFDQYFDQLSRASSGIPCICETCKNKIGLKLSIFKSEPSDGKRPLGKSEGKSDDGKFDGKFDGKSREKLVKEDISNQKLITTNN